MGKQKDISPHKIGQIEVYLSETTFKQKDIAKKLNVSTQTISAIKKKMENKEGVLAKRVGNCGRKRVTTPRIDRKITRMSLNNRRSSCIKLSRELLKENITVHPRTINNRLLERGLHAYRPRKKPRLTPKMVTARYAWAKTHIGWTSEQWEQVRLYKIEY